MIDITAAKKGAWEIIVTGFGQVTVSTKTVSLVIFEEFRFQKNVLSHHDEARAVEDLGPKVGIAVSGGQNC